MSEEIKVHEDHKQFKRKTDPRFTKKVNVAGKPAFTNIDTYYLIEEATKEYGLFGKGWGFKETSYETINLGDTTLLTLHAVFFYGDKGEFPISNSEKLSYMTKQKYVKVDEDAYKKVETNTIAKALSRIGFGTDIYLGKWDNQDYVNEAWGETEITLEHLQELTPLIASTKTDLTAFNKEFNISKLKELKQEDFNKALALLRAKQARMNQS